MLSRCPIVRMWHSEMINELASKIGYDIMVHLSSFFHHAYDTVVGFIWPK